MLTDTDVAARGQALYAEVATLMRQRQQQRARLRYAALAGAGVVLLGGAHLVGRDRVPWDWGASAVALFATLGILLVGRPDRAALERYERWGWLALDREILGWIRLALGARRQRRERLRARRGAPVNAVATILAQVVAVLPPACPWASADGGLPQQWRALRARAAPPPPSAPPPEGLDQWQDRLRTE